ncbi:MAG: helix-turn-helix transcriptional regulator [Verrucomicrobia bacterium]|nr:helix-turn-helix transcriptional regulator [Verrucomicrobiota bacterium]
MAESPPIVIRSLPSLVVRRFSFAGVIRSVRSPCFTLFLLERGNGSVRVDHATHDFAAPALLCLNPYQRVVFAPGRAASGWMLQFHANFFCIETHHHAVGCNGVLFNEVYDVPLVRLEPDQMAEFERLTGQMDHELRQQAVAHLEVLVSCLKILLIKATRLKLEQQGEGGLAATKRPEVLRRFRELLETHYQSLHSPSEYARLLGTSPKILARLARVHFHKTLAEVIRDRVMKHAKWQLLHTLKPVKQVAHEVGFDDEFYFSRIFKRSFGCSPAVFREQETASRGGANLSM